MERGSTNHGPLHDEARHLKREISAGRAPLRVPVTEWRAPQRAQFAGPRVRPDGPHWPYGC